MAIVTSAAAGGTVANHQPTKEELAVLRRANGLMNKSREEGVNTEMEKEAARLLVSVDETLRDWVMARMKKTKGPPLKVSELVYQAFCSRMMRRDLVGAAAILWGQGFFNAEPWAVLLELLRWVL